MIFKKCSTTDQKISEFAENLAYDVSEEFGNKFKIWLGEDKNRNAGAETKVRHLSNLAQSLSSSFSFPGT